jgi:hypothetical protein
MINNKGQLSIFVIVVIGIVVGFVIYIVLSENFGKNNNLPTEFGGVFEYYESCVLSEGKRALEVAGSQGGRIDVGEYIYGSEYAPSGNQLNFMGQGVPYWFYLSKNGLLVENIPSLGDIEQDVAGYIRNRIRECEFEQFYQEGFEIKKGVEEVFVKIREKEVEIEVRSDFTVSKDAMKGSKGKFNVLIMSDFGTLYGEAREIYEKQKDEAFLEEYGVDVLRLYAPVDGVEISCSPKVWVARDVVEDLKVGLEGNIQSLKLRGDYYDLSEKQREYFVIDHEVDNNVNFLYSKTWPTKIEIFDTEGELMIANPIGNQAGLGILGFCYIPYHFVYDISFPVMIQIYNSNEFFQFPVLAIIDNNVIRKANLLEFESAENVELCNYRTKKIEVNLFDENLNNIDGNVSYKCFNQACYLGETTNGMLLAEAPSCYNGQILVNSGGFKESKEIFSTSIQSDVDLILRKEYEVEVEVEMNGRKIPENVFVSFLGEENNGGSVFLPDSNKVKLTEGFYDISVQVYGNTRLRIPASSKRQCYDVPKGVIGGIFGITKEECVEISLPETVIESALIGGGEGREYILEENLEGGKIKVVVGQLPIPNTLEGLQYNFESFKSLNAFLEFQ